MSVLSDRGRSGILPIEAAGESPVANSTTMWIRTFPSPEIGSWGTQISGFDYKITKSRHLSISLVAVMGIASHPSLYT